MSKKLINFSCLIFVLLSGPAQGQGVSPISSLQFVPSPGDTVLTIKPAFFPSEKPDNKRPGTFLDPFGFLSPLGEWLDEFNDIVFNYEIGSRKTPNGYAFSGTLYVYTTSLKPGQFGMVTRWPHQKMATITTRELFSIATAFKHIHIPERFENIRFYKYKMITKVSTTSILRKRYKTDSEEMLFIFYLVPYSGERKAAIYRNGALFPLRSDPSLPENITQTSMQMTVRAASVQKSSSTLHHSLPKNYPTNLYSTAIYSFNGWGEGGFIMSQNGETEPMNPFASGPDIDCFEHLLNPPKDQKNGPEEIDIIDAKLIMNAL